MVLVLILILLRQCRYSEFNLADLSQEQACVCTMEARLMFCSDASGPHAKPGCETNSRERHCEDVRLPNLLATSHCFLFRISIV
jgi:hypothetical protein